jgi:predicted O-methyltransferase YrrM
MRSVRFFPHWNIYDTNQVIGLIQMVNYILSVNPQANHWIEIGSYNGESSSIFLGFAQITLLECVDMNRGHINTLNKKHQKDIDNNRCIIHHKYSSEFLKSIPDESVDVIYIDGDHRYNGVKKDIDLSFSKLKNNGLLAGHDYHKRWPGVQKAVDTFMEKNNITNFEQFRDTSWVIQKK